MDAQIVMDCQTKKETVSCGYCIAKETCHLRLELEEKTGTYHVDDLLAGSVSLIPLLQMRV